MRQKVILIFSLLVLTLASQASADIRMYEKRAAQGAFSHDCNFEDFLKKLKLTIRTEGQRARIASGLSSTEFFYIEISRCKVKLAKRTVISSDGQEDGATAYEFILGEFKGKIRVGMYPDGDEKIRIFPIAVRIDIPREKRDTSPVSQELFYRELFELEGYMTIVTYGKQGLGEPKTWEEIASADIFIVPSSITIRGKVYKLD